MHATVDRNDSKRRADKCSPLTTISILAIGSIGSWSIIILGVRALM